MPSKKTLLIILLLTSNIIFAQISVSFPVSRAVFQRNNQNIGFINIIGNYTQAIEKVEAKLTPITNGQGTPTDWILIDSNPKAGNFIGKIEGQGGWYQLEIRAFQNGKPSQSIMIEKVGIGEVFICLGQSNAEGIFFDNRFNNTLKSANDDRVNAVDFQEENLEYPLPEKLNFTKLTANVKIAPHGSNAWCWGELGDKLAQKLNVPILFFNAGLARTAVKNWRESAEGVLSRRYDDNGNGQTHFPLNYPYNFLRGTLNYYASLLGVRSLLWMQGETDNRRTSLADHQSDLQKVVNYSRKDFDENLTWMIARTSMSFQLPPDNNTLSAQNNVINTAGNNVFAGPETDGIQQPRPDGIHIGNVAGFGDGLSELANAWNNALNENFFLNSKPVLAKSVLSFEILCNNLNIPHIKLPEGFRNYDWSNGGKTSQISEKGNFYVKVFDNRGNRILTPSFATDWIFPISKPTITASKPLEFCSTDSTELKANGAEFSSFLWNTGETKEKIFVKQAADFVVKGINNFGCISSESDKITTKIATQPTQPKITSTDANSVCEGQSILLFSDGNEKFLWNNGETTKSIKIEKVGDFEANVKSINQFGCVSPVSSSFRITIRPRPKTPEIVQSSAFILSAQNGNFVSDDKFEWKLGETILSTSANQNLKVSTAGNYKVSTLRTYQVLDNKLLTCGSLPSTPFSFTPSEATLLFYPNPITNDVVSLETKDILQNLRVDFFNFEGKAIKKFSIEDTSQKQDFKVNDLPNGNYWVKIYNDTLKQTIRVLVERK